MSGSLAVLAELSVRGRFNDSDMWWHLKSGEVIWTSHAVPKVDLFSFTALHHSLVPQEWLSQTLIYGAYKLAGFPGLMLCLCVLAASLFITGYILSSLYSGNAKIGLLGAIVLWFFSTSGLSMRPQMIGYLLLAIELLILHLSETRSSRWLLGLPPLFVVWVNAHGSFFLGLLVAAVVLACSFFNFEAGSLVCRRWKPERRRMFSGMLALSCGAVFLNPDGWRQVLYPLNTMFRQPANLSFVQEWHPLTLHDARGIGLMGVLVLIFLVLLIRRSKVLYLDELVLLGMGAWLGLSHRRMAFVFGILAAPVVARLLSDFWEGYEAEKDRVAPNMIFLAAVAMALYLGFPNRQVLAKQVNEFSPTKAVAYIQSHRLSGNMLNDYEFGGYLIWALPEHPVFIDGRADLYEWAGVLKQYHAWAWREDNNPNTLLDKYHIGFCLLERSSPMAQALPLLPNWKEVYSDDLSIVIVRTSAMQGTGLR